MFILSFSLLLFFWCNNPVDIILLEKMLCRECFLFIPNAAFPPKAKQIICTGRFHAKSTQTWIFNSNKREPHAKTQDLLLHPDEWPHEISHYTTPLLLNTGLLDTKDVKITKLVTFYTNEIRVLLCIVKRRHIWMLFRDYTNDDVDCIWNLKNCFITRIRALYRHLFVTVTSFYCCQKAQAQVLQLRQRDDYIAEKLH